MPHTLHRTTLRFLPALLLALAAPASAFTVFPGYVVFESCGGVSCPDDVERTLREAPRWDAQGGLVTLADGIRVGVEPGFAEAIQSGTTMPLDVIEQAVIDAFGAWETPEVQFDVHFDMLLPSDVQLHAVEGATHPTFQGNGFSGFATISTVFGTRRLTSGVLGVGHSIWGGEILIAPDRLWQSFGIWVLSGLLRARDAVARFTNLMIHEIGHVLGLHHQNEFPAFNFDDDGDPFTVVSPDPLAPWTGLEVSENVDPNAIMRGGLPADFSSFIATELYADDRSGLNVLYPSLSVPEPGGSALVLLALTAAARKRVMLAFRRRRRTPWPRSSNPPASCSTP